MATWSVSGVSPPLGGGANFPDKFRLMTPIDFIFHMVVAPDIADPLVTCLSSKEVFKIFLARSKKKLLENSMKNVKNRQIFDDVHQSFYEKSKQVPPARVDSFWRVRWTRFDFCSKAWVVRNILETWNIPATALENFLSAFESWESIFQKHYFFRLFTGWVRPSSIFHSKSKNVTNFQTPLEFFLEQ